MLTPCSVVGEAGTALQASEAAEGAVQAHMRRRGSDYCTDSDARKATRMRDRSDSDARPQ